MYAVSNNITLRHSYFCPQNTLDTDSKFWQSVHMNKTFNVTFICDYMVVMTSVDIDEQLDDEQIAGFAGAYVYGNYGFNPNELSYDYEVIEV